MSERPVGHESCLICQDREEQSHPCGHEAEIASLRTQVETLNGWKEGALVGTAEMRKEVAFWRERAEAAERELGESKATVRLLQDMDADVCDCWAIRARAEAAEAKLAQVELRGRVLEGEWNRTIARAEAAEGERDELEALFQLQWRRGMEVFERWRAEGKLDNLTWPDYRKAINWLLTELESAWTGRDPHYHLTNEHQLQWWFWDEVQVEELGPWTTRQEAMTAMAEYARWLDDGTVGTTLAKLRQVHGEV